MITQRKYQINERNCTDSELRHEGGSAVCFFIGFYLLGKLENGEFLSSCRSVRVIRFVMLHFNIFQATTGDTDLNILAFSSNCSFLTL